MRTAAALFLTAAVLVCGRGPPPSETAKPPSDRREPSDTACVVCAGDGTRALTPEVTARPDGVHYEIDNRMGINTGYSVETPEGGGMGDNAPKGKSKRVGDFPPGKVWISCENPPVDGVDTNYTSLSIVAGEGGYKSVELECPSGQGVMGIEASVSEEARGEKGDPVELTRRAFSGRLEEADAVEPAGYPKSKGGKAVRVVRDGRVTAVVDYARWKGGWMQKSYTACENS